MIHNWSISQKGAILGVCLLTLCIFWGTQANSNNQKKTGVKGLVLRGPLRPGPQIIGRPSEAPFSATFYVLNDQGDKVLQFLSNKTGRFQIFLAPGIYIIVPDDSAPILRPSHQRKRVTVTAGEMVEVTMRFDTGLR